MKRKLILFCTSGTEICVGTQSQHLGGLVYAGRHGHQRYKNSLICGCHYHLQGQTFGMRKLRTESKRILRGGGDRPGA